MTTTATRHARFPLGRLVATCGIVALTDSGKSIPLFALLARHAAGDWGEVCAEDARENELSLTHGYRLMSVYDVPGVGKVWIITEADRSATTVLLPEEY